MGGRLSGLNSNKPMDASAFYNRGSVYKAQGDNALAIADYTEAIRLNPQRAITFYNRGKAYDAQGDTARSIADYNEAIRLNPQFVDAFNNRGKSYHAQGDHARAIADYNEAIRLNPQRAITFNHRGNAYDAQGDTARAIADYNEAIRLNPELVKSFNEEKLKGFYKNLPNFYKTLVKHLSLRQRLDACEGNLPEKFKDPIHHSLINDPIMLHCGDNFDRETILSFITNRTGSCPCCRQIIDPSNLSNPAPNTFMRCEIIEYVESKEQRASQAIAHEQKEEQPALQIANNEPVEQADALAIDLESASRDRRSRQAFLERVEANARQARRDCQPIPSAHSSPSVAKD